MCWSDGNGLSELTNIRVTKVGIQPPTAKFDWPASHPLFRDSRTTQPTAAIPSSQESQLIGPRISLPEPTNTIGSVCHPLGPKERYVQLTSGITWA